VALFLDLLPRCKAIIPLVRFVGQPTGAPAASQPTPNVSSHDHCGKTLYFTQITSSSTTTHQKNADALPAAARSAGFRCHQDNARCGSASRISFIPGSKI